MPDLPPSSAAVERAVALVGRDAMVQTVCVLAGGTHARTYLIQTANPQSELILREFPAGDRAAYNEARVLAALDGLDGLAPLLLATDPAGAPGEGPWAFISRLPGTADIIPCQPAAFADQLGKALARIHATSLSRMAGLPRVLDRPGGSLAVIGGPAASQVLASWEFLSRAPSVLTHYDFWSGNTLWDNGVLTGVVDWSGGALGPRGFDVGWCRLDLYLLYDQDVADRFLTSYQAASNSALGDPRPWGLWAAARSHEEVESWTPNYRDLGRTDLTASELRKRHTAWTEYLLGH